MAKRHRAPDDYKVGRGKPPKHTQFPKGKSGNPAGRPKGSKNFKSTLDKELARRVAVSEDGRRRKITKREAFAKQLVNKAVSGDPKGMTLLLNETRDDGREADGPDAAAEVGDPMDQLVLDNIIERIRASTTSPQEADDEQALAHDLSSASAKEERDP